MTQSKRDVYSAAVRKQAVKILADGAGHRSLAAKLKIPEATARQWSRAYAVGGEQAVLNAGARHNIYDYDTKLAVVRDRLEKGKTVREVMIEYGVPSESSVKSWCRLYRAKGPEALIDKPRGRKPKNRAPEAQGPEGSQQ